MMIFRILLLGALFASQSAARAAETQQVMETAERFVRQQLQGQSGQLVLTPGKLDVSRLPPCAAHEAFAPPGTRLSGRTHVGVRCLGPSAWSVLVPFRISFIGDYVTTRRALVAGQVVAAEDLTVVSGDLTALPTGVVTNPLSAVGKSLRNSLGGGQPLRNDQLVATLVIRQNQTVRVISQGAGFAVSAEGKALGNAAAGQVVSIRMANGQTISGIARPEGSVEVGF